MLKPTKLFSEDGVNFSLGRITFWLILSISIFFWFKKPVDAFPPSLLHTLYLLIGYNVSKKVIAAKTNEKKEIDK